MWHDGEFDEYNNYGDDDLPSDWFSSSPDAFDEYEDYVMETGADPYHVFDDDDLSLRTRVLKAFKGIRRQCRRAYHRFQDWRYGKLPDDIPF